MYNRYVPQPDGSYRRCRLPDKSKPEPSRPLSSSKPAVPKPAPPHPPCPPPEQPPCPPPSKPQPPHRESCRNPQEKPAVSLGVGNFFRQLLPKDFDTGDLLVILLLLLMAGDCQEDQNTALLTMALYLFM